ncbi:DUF1800 family protein [soil metagenome]
MAITDFPDSATRAAIAAHRFGLGEPSLAALQNDPQGWLLAQIGPADAPRGDGLLSTREASDYIAAERERRERARNPPPGMTAQQVLAGRYREIALADARSRLITAATTTRPFAERLQLFWCNHFTVSLAKGSTRGLVGAFEREAIRPHIAGSFETLLMASTTHPAMLRYLDNVQSAGANSRVAQRQARRAASLAANATGTRNANGAGAVTDDPPRVIGINENLAREVLELHTLGAESGRNGPDGGYGQADVTAFDPVLPGWRIGAQGNDLAQPFDANWHEPGAKTVLGRRYAEGPDALRQVLHDLAHHPATARFISTKLARHFVADTPPPALVDRLTLAYLRNDAQLGAVYRELIQSPEAWSPQPAKLKTPEEFVISSVRMLGLNERAFDRNDATNPANGIGNLGQRLQAAPSPAGWSDRAEDWLGPDAVWKRVEWSTRVADRLGRNIDARSLAAQSLGPLLGADTQRQIERAADGPQALALLLMAPEFQRR